MKKPPKVASRKPIPCEVRNFRIAVTSSPQPVALSTTVGTNEVDGCSCSRAVKAKKAAMRITIPSAVQSKLLPRLRSLKGLDVVLESIWGVGRDTSSVSSQVSVVVSGLSGLFMYAHLLLL